MTVVTWQVWNRDFSRRITKERSFSSQEEADKFFENQVKNNERFIEVLIEVVWGR